MSNLKRKSVEMDPAMDAKKPKSDDDMEEQGVGCTSEGSSLVVLPAESFSSSASASGAWVDGEGLPPGWKIRSVSWKKRSGFFFFKTQRPQCTVLRSKKAVLDHLKNDANYTQADVDRFEMVYNAPTNNIGVESGQKNEADKLALHTNINVSSDHPDVSEDNKLTNTSVVDDTNTCTSEAVTIKGNTIEHVGVAEVSRKTDQPDEANTNAELTGERNTYGNITD